MKKEYKIGLITLGVIVVLYVLMGKTGIGGVPVAPSYQSASSTVYSIGHQLSTKILDVRGGRGYASICNLANGGIAYIDFSTTYITATTSADIPLDAGECYEIDRDKLYTGQVNAMRETSTSTTLFVTEFLGY